MRGPLVHVGGLLLPACLLLPPAAALGVRLARSLSRGLLTPAEERVTGWALGLGLAGYAPFALAAAGALRRGPLLVVLLLAWLAAAVTLARGRRSPSPSSPAARSRLDRAAATACLLFLAVVFFQNLLEALAPPVDIDTLSHQLAIPRLVAEAGRFPPLPTFLQAHWPSQQNVLYSACLLLGGPSSAQVLQVAAAACLAASVAVLTGGRLAGLLAAAFLFAAPDVRSVLGTARVDLTVALHEWTALALVGLWASRPAARGRAGDGILTLAALALGLALATKLLAAVALAVLPPVVYLVDARRGPRGPALARAAVLPAVAVLVASPWLVKSWIETGNPVWPFLHGLFGGADWSPEMSRRVLGEGRWASVPGRSPLANVLLAPFEIFARPERFLGWPHVFFAPLLVIALLRATRSPRSLAAPSAIVPRAWLAFAAGFLLLWAIFLPNEARYLLPAYVPLAALAGGWGARLLAGGGARALATGAVFAAALADPFLFHQQDVGRFARPALGGAAAREAFLRREVPPTRAIEWINRTLPADAMVLLLGEVRGFSLERRYLRGRLESQAVVDFHALPDAARARARLAELGVTHLLVNRDRLGPPPPADGGQRALSIVYALVDGATPLFEADGCAVLALAGERGAAGGARAP